MATHESSVNFQNLIRDLADMYPQDISDIVIVELVANSLDAHAQRIAIDYDPCAKILVISDNGAGMDASQFDQYHDFAAGLKTRGTGIGFAGVGAKVSFNVADRVLTETRSLEFSGGSDWHMESNNRLVWEEIEPTHLTHHGTRVEVRFKPDETPDYTTTEDLVSLLRRNYLPMFDEKFIELYHRMGVYSRDFQFVVNGQPIDPGDVATDFGTEHTKSFYPESSNKLIGIGVLGLSPSEYPLGANIGGVLLCTHGKVIKGDLFNQFLPGNIGPRLFGLVEVPGFVNFLTTAKNDFIRGKGRLREFERMYDPIRQEFRQWLTALGVEPTQPEDNQEAALLERELRRMSEVIPELSEFFGFRSRSAVLGADHNGEINSDIQNGADVTFPDGEGIKGSGPGILDVGDGPGEALVENRENGAIPATPISRTARRGPRIAFDARPDRIELAWVDGNSVVINSGHPSYKKVGSNGLAKRVHSLFAIATAVQKFSASNDDSGEMMLADRILSAWGMR